MNNVGTYLDLEIVKLYSISFLFTTSWLYQLTAIDFLVSFIALQKSMKGQES